MKWASVAIGEHGILGGTNVASSNELLGTVKQYPIREYVTNIVSWITPASKFFLASSIRGDEYFFPEMEVEVGKISTTSPVTIAFGISPEELQRTLNMTKFGQSEVVPRRDVL
jgi:hypothetical protein